MPATSVLIEAVRCLWPKCGKLARLRVFGVDGEEEGEFCGEHGHKLVKRLNDGQQATFDYEAGKVTFTSD